MENKDEPITSGLSNSLKMYCFKYGILFRRRVTMLVVAKIKILAVEVLLHEPFRPGSENNGHGAEEPQLNFITALVY